MPVSKPTDARTLTLPVGAIWQIVATVLATALSVWAVTSELKSDIRDIRTRMETQRQLEEAQATVRAMELNALKASIETLRIGLEDVRKRQDLFNERQTAVTRR